MNSDELCFAILRADTEEVVSQILDDHLESVGQVDWHPIDARESNFNVVTNQAATGGKALTELCTNMVDAILLRRAYERGIEPESPNAPQSVIAAVKDLVRLKGAPSGILAEVDDVRYLKEFSEEHLVIGVTGQSGRGTKPSFTFVDAGEGQHGADFRDTFLSLSSGRKSKIPFVQGKYNMGSSGVLSFCGRRWHKLIISRRYDRTGPWAWTLVRRRPGDGTPIAEYLTIDGELPELRTNIIRPFILRDGTEDAKVTRDSGTIVKLYSYELGGSVDFRTVRESLNENLISTILPFRLMDFRATPSRGKGPRRGAGVDERTLSGMDTQLRRLDDEADDDADELAGEPIQVEDISDPELGTIRIQAIPLPRSLPGWLRVSRNRNRVYHAVNGQVQYKESRTFLTQCRLPGLKDRVVILVDASDMTEAAHNDIWKGDREAIRQTSVGNTYRRMVRDSVRSSEVLRKLQERIVAEETEHATQQTQTELFESIVNTDRNIAQLLPGGTVVRLRQGSGQGGGGGDEWEGRYNPTFVRHASERLRNEGVAIEADDQRRVRFLTDAANDWLTRPDNRGAIVLEGDNAHIFGIRSALHDGSLSVTIRPVPGRAVVGTVASLKLVLRDDAMPLPVSEDVQLRIVEQRPHRPPGPPRPRPLPGPNDGDAGGEQRDLPPMKWLTRDGRDLRGEATELWPEGFTDQDGGTVEQLTDDQFLYKINYDNAHFQDFLRKERSDPAKRVVTEQYRISMLVLMMGLEHAFKSMSDQERQEELQESIDDIRRLAAQGAATVVMSIAKTLPQLINPDTVGDPDDD